MFFCDIRFMGWILVVSLFFIYCLVLVSVLGWFCMLLVMFVFLFNWLFLLVVSFYYGGFGVDIVGVCVMVILFFVLWFLIFSVLLCKCSFVLR